MSAAAILIPILSEIGAPILKRIIQNKMRGTGGEIAADAIDVVAERLGTAATPEAIVDRYAEDPNQTASVVQQVEADYSEQWLAYLDLLSIDARSNDPLQRRWRPITALMFAAACFLLVVTVPVAILLRIPLDESLLPLVGMVGTVIVPWAGVVGWYVKSRSDEKIAGRV